MLDRKMAIFGYQHVQYPISRQRIRIKQREMFRWKALQIIQNHSKTKSKKNISCLKKGGGVKKIGSRSISNKKFCKRKKNE